MHRIYHEELDSTQKTYKLVDQDYHHAVNVLKIKNGDQAILFSSAYEGLFKIENISKKHADLILIEKLRDKEIIPEIHLLTSIIKGDKMSNIVDVATQFGVKSITPIISANCYIRDFNYDRMKSVAISALCQSRGMTMPVFNNMTKIQDIGNIINDETLLFGDLSDRSINPNGINSTNGRKIFCIVGPEGGLTDSEVDFLYSLNNSFGISLAKRVLRSETAVGAILSVANMIFPE
jgi:16S rRNA (uracil1498-N3)-methyltransferase